MPTATRPGTVHPVSAASSRRDENTDQSRLSMVVRMIEHITGRQVKLVPPTAYLVSAATAKTPQGPPVEVAVTADVEAGSEPTEEPLVVDVSAVLREGTSERMILGEGDQGGLALFSGLNVVL